MNMYQKWALLFSVLLFWANPQLAQAPSPSSPASQSSDTATDKNFNFIPVPYMDYNRSLGFSLGAVPLAMYHLSKKDTISPSSISGGVGFYSTTQSWFVVQFNRFYFNRDNYRVTLIGGTGNINFQFFLENPISPGYIDYNTVADFVKVEIQRKAYKKLYLGINYSYSKVKTEFEVDNAPPLVDFFNSIGAVASIDTRDNVYYPHKGFISNINYSSFPEFMDNTYVSEKIEFEYNHFYTVGNERDIIATRGYVGMGLGDLQFNQQFVVGRTDIRGYSLGKYRGNQIIALQSEFRYNPFKKLGFVGFCGIASVFGAINEGDDGLILPGMGVGVRYIVFEKNHMNVGLDAAVGKGDWGLYFKIGESF